MKVMMSSIAAKVCRDLPKESSASSFSKCKNHAHSNPANVMTTGSSDYTLFENIP
jgi:hypothetical protein